MLHAVVNLLENSAHCIDTWHMRPWQVAWLGVYTASNKCPATEKDTHTQTHSGPHETRFSLCTDTVEDHKLFDTCVATCTCVCGDCDECKTIMMVLIECV